MKGKIALLMATVMAVTSFSAVTMAASSNSVVGRIWDMNADEILIEYVDDRSIDVLNTQEGMDSVASGTPVSMQLRPTSEVESGSSIILTVENGKFDERLVNADPFIFRTNETGTTYDEIMTDERSPEEVLAEYVGGEKSRQLPYGFRYISPEQIEVYLYPISADKVNQNNSDVTDGTPIYNIPMPVTTEGSKSGDLVIAIDSNDSAISSGTYTAAKVKNKAEEPVYDEGYSDNYINKSQFKLGKNEVLISGIESNGIDILDTQSGIDSLAKGTPIALSIIPTAGIESDTTIVLNIENGKFDERLIDANPYKYESKNERSYDMLMDMLKGGASLETVFINNIGNQGERKLPYEYKYINESQIEVTLFPVDEEWVNKNNNDVTQGIPYYRIALPVTTEDSDYGDVKLSVDPNGTVITGGVYTAATVTENPDEDKIEVSPGSNSSINTINKGNVHINRECVLIENVNNNSVDILDTQDGIDSLREGSPVTLQIRPKSEVEPGDSIILIAENGKFDERLINTAPYIYKSENGRNYEDLIPLVYGGASIETVLTNNVGNQGERKLPYGIRYINEKQIEVELFPIGDNKVNQNNTDVTYGIPYYNIALPMTTEGSIDGALKVGIYSNGTSIAGGYYNVAAVGDTNMISDGGSSSNSVNSSDTQILKDSVLIRNVEDNSINILENENGIQSLAEGEPVALQICPSYEVEKGSAILLTVENGKFDERLVNADPFVFKTEVSNKTYDELMADGRESRYVLTDYIGNEGSSKLPYSLKYISPEMLEVSLFPIDDVYVNINDVTQGIPYYNIALPVTSEGSEIGDIKLSVDSNGTVIKGGEYIIGSVIEYVETTTESTTITSSETTTEKTTATEITTEITSISTESSTETSTETASESTETTTETATETSTETSSESSTADVTDSTEETTDEATETTTSTATEVTTDEATETTTRRVSRGGGGGGSSSRSTTTTTTAATTTTETATEATTGEVTTEAATETTTENIPEVRVSIGSSNIVVDNRTYAMDVAPYIQSNSNSTLVPLRFVAVALTGGNVDSADTSDIVSWDSSTKQAIISKDGIRVVFTAGSNIVTVNGQEMTMDHGVTAEIKDDRMFIPFRAMGEILGYGVEWDADTKTAIYNTAL